MKIKRLRNIKKIVKEILEDDKLARTDDCYLILEVIRRLYPNEICKKFYDVMFNAKYKGISFESITRARRQVQKQYPKLKNNKVAEIRDKEQNEYREFAKEG